MRLKGGIVNANLEVVAGLPTASKRSCHCGQECQVKPIYGFGVE